GYAISDFAVIVQDVHVRSLATSTRLSRYYFPDAVSPLAVAAVMGGVGIGCVLVGTHANGVWMNKPRTTDDVDIVVATTHHKHAVNELLRVFKRMEKQESGKVTHLRDRATQRKCVDVFKPD